MIVLGWIADVAILIVFASFGGFPGFVAWATLTIVWILACRALALRAAEIALRAREADRRYDETLEELLRRLRDSKIRIRALSHRTFD